MCRARRRLNRNTNGTSQVRKKLRLRSYAPPWRKTWCRGATTCARRRSASFPSRYHSAGIIIRQARRPTFRLSSPSIRDIIPADAVNILFQAARLVPQRPGIKMMYRRSNEFYKSADWRRSPSRSFLPRAQAPSRERKLSENSRSRGLAQKSSQVHLQT